MKTCRQCGTQTEDPFDGLCGNCRTLKDHPDATSKRSTLAGVPFQDMKQMDESHRLTYIAQLLSEHPGQEMAVMVDTGPGYEGKGDRYIEGIKRLLPAVTVVRRGPGPVAGAETIILTEPKFNPSHQ